ncbi:Uncharacterised protein [uncultured archaeon]|nr:Uncharacterised protein [uncultured archaeon]
MAKKYNVTHHHVRERVAGGILTALLGCIWLAAELGWFQTTVPLGPLIVIFIGMTMLLPWLRND